MGDNSFTSDMIDRATGRPFEDPVHVGNTNFERRTVEELLARQRANNEPLTLPDGVPYNEEAIESNEELKTKIHRVMTLAVARKHYTIYSMGNCLGFLDDFSDLLRETLEGWTPPCVILMGPEQTGKSSVLERLTLLPIFPRGAHQMQKMTTCAAVHVRLRRGPARPVVMKFVKVNEDKTEEIFERKEYTWEEAHKKVETTMLNWSKDTQFKISKECMIVIDVMHPTVPSINLIDLPGLVVDDAANAEKSRLIKELVEYHLDTYKDNAIFLCTHYGFVPTAHNLALPLITQHNIQSKTIGVVTHCDLVIKSGSGYKLKRFVDGTEGTFQPHGFILVGNIGKDSAVSEPDSTSQPSPKPFLGRVNEIFEAADRETDFFQDGIGLDPEMCIGKLSNNALAKRVDDIFSMFLTESWLPRTVQLVSQKVTALESDLRQLGFPEYDVNKFVGNQAEHETFGKCISIIMNKFFKLAFERVHEHSIGLTTEGIAMMVLAEHCTRPHPLINGKITVNVDSYASAERYIRQTRSKLQDFISGAVKGIRNLWLEGENALEQQLAKLDVESLFKITRFEKFVGALCAAFETIVTEGIETGFNHATACITNAFITRPSCVVDVSGCEKKEGDAKASVNVVIHVHKIVKDVLSCLIGGSTVEIQDAVTNLISNTLRIPNPDGAVAVAGPRLALDEGDLVKESTAVELARKKHHEDLQKLDVVRVKLLKAIVQSAVVALRSHHVLEPLYQHVLVHHTRVLAASSLPLETMEIVRRSPDDLLNLPQLSHINQDKMKEVLDLIKVVARKNAKTEDAERFAEACNELSTFFSSYDSPLMEGIGAFGQVYTPGLFPPTPAAAPQPPSSPSALPPAPPQEQLQGLALCAAAVQAVLGVPETAVKSILCRNRSAKNAVNEKLTKEIIDNFVRGGAEETKAE